LAVVAAFLMTACATELYQPPVYVLCPGDKQPHYMSVEAFKDKPSCFLY
jgi:hypothetical protein